MDIDVVVPMVFPSDRIWWQRFKHDSIHAGRTFCNNDRVRSWGLERYFFRGLAKFMPWVHNVYVILDSESQMPEWLTGVKVVYHRDIIPAHLLPTYNSQTIEMYIGNIKGLSECFIYANDDMICCSELMQSEFFKDGMPVIRCHEHVEHEDNVFLSSLRNSMRMAARVTYYRCEDNIVLKDGHSYAPMLLSTVREMQTLYGGEMEKSCTRFRQRQNISQYLYTFRQWLTFRCVEGHHPHHYCNECSDIDGMREVLRSGDAGVCCFNDGGNRIERFAKAVREELDAILSEPSKYEK